MTLKLKGEVEVEDKCLHCGHLVVKLTNHGWSHKHFYENLPGNYYFDDFCWGADGFELKTFATPSSERNLNG